MVNSLDNNTWSASLGDFYRAMLCVSAVFAIP